MVNKIFRKYRVENKITLLRWCGWFFFGNAFLFLIIGFHYLPNIPWIGTPYLSSHSQFVLKIFIFLAYIGHLGMLAFLPCVFIIPLILTIPLRFVIFSVAISLATLLGVLLIVDTIAYQLYRFHLNGVVIELVFHGLGKELLGLSWLEIISAIGVMGALLLAQIFFAKYLWRLMTKNKFRGLGKWIGIFFSLSLYASYSMIAYSQGYPLNRVIVDVSRFLPFYTTFLGAILPVKEGKTVIECMALHYVLQPNEVNASLHYPLEKLQYKMPKKPFNLVIIVIDALRFDLLNAINTPNLFRFSQKAWVFNHHFSGGNATGPGIFSIFYGLPFSYWTAMENQHYGPVFLDRLLAEHYQMGIFGSATLTLPPFNKTVFSAIRNLQTSTVGQNPYERDQKITSEFKTFIAEAKKSSYPFFSFLFYDGVHSYCSYPEDLIPFQPVIKQCIRLNLTNKANPLIYLNRYKNAVLLVDQEIKEILASLEENHLLTNTVLLITSDHGEEFNDNHLGYWSHASNFTSFQTQTPFILYWPNDHHRVFNYPTSHFDIAPFLMKYLLGCITPPNRYSVGKNLLDKTARPYFIVNSYVNMGIIEPDRITNVFATGGFRIDQINGKPFPEASLNISLMEHVLKDLRRFYQG